MKKQKEIKKHVRSIVVTGLLSNGLIGHTSKFTWNPAFEPLFLEEKVSKRSIKRVVVEYLDKIKMDSMSRYIKKTSSRRIVIVNTNKGKFSI